jgi:hypothetical protein
VCKPKSTLHAMAYFKDATRDIDEDTTREELNGVYFNSPRECYEDWAQDPRQDAR